MRVLHLPTSVGGNAWNLSLAERSLGVDSHVLVIGQNYFGFKADMVVDWNRSRFVYPLKALGFYLKELKKYDILHFNFGRTLYNYPGSVLDMLDLPVLKKLGKRIVVTYQGSDARLAKYSLEHYDISYYRDLPAEERMVELAQDEVRVRRMTKVDRYADLIYTTNPDLKNVLPSRTIFRPYTKLQLADWQPHYSDYEKSELVLAHAPTSRAKKGTDIILQAVETLRRDGINVRLELFENLPNDELRNRMATADIVIDQLYIGWYGGLAVESMALGKPVVAYIRESDMAHIPLEMDREMPILRANPQNLCEVLRSSIADRAHLGDLAHRSRAYVEHWHDSRTIATRIIEDYERIL